MAERIMFSKDEMDRIKGIQERYQNTIYNFGQLEIEQKLLNNKKASMDADYEILAKAELDILNELNDKYGKGHIDLATGTFTPIS